MIESVAAVLVHGDHLFHIRRQLNLNAFPGYLAFPGGKIDEGEQETPFLSPMLQRHPPRLLHALCRELNEELQFDLVGAIQAGDVKDVMYLGLAKPPTPAMGRFSSHHFKILLNRKIDFTVDPNEAFSSGWERAVDLYEMFNLGKFLAVIPTIRVIEELARDIHAGPIEKLNAVCDSSVEVPILELIRGVRLLFIESRTFKPVQKTNALIVGDPPYLIDPSPSSPEELARVLYTIKPFALKGILITHHHPDHHENAFAIAGELGLPVRCSPETIVLMKERYGAGCFSNCEVIPIDEGDVLTMWLGQAIRVYSLPGHDRGQIGIAPDGMEWFLVGDLIQASNWNILGVVIPEKEGDMGSYISSLQHVIDLNPGIIIPSHGMPLGTIFPIRDTLKARLEREELMLKLHLEGKDEDGILFSAYGQIDESMKIFARWNIRAHLKKLAREGRI